MHFSPWRPTKPRRAGLRLAAAAAATALLTVAAVQPAWSAEQDQEVDAIIRTIDAADADFLAFDQLDQGRSFTAPKDLPERAATAVTTGPNQVGLSVVSGESLSGAVSLSENAVAYIGETHTRITVDQGMGVIAMGTIIQGDETENRFHYNVDYDGQIAAQIGEVTGGVLLFSDGAVVGGLAAPWAVDSEGRSVPTWYEVEGKSITQVVDHLQGDWSYPIFADPTYYGSPLIDYVTATSSPWETHVYTSGWWAYNNNNPLFKGLVVDEYAAITPSAYDTQGAREQVSCHAWWAALKHPWNIELWRPTVGEAATVAAACNPT